MNYLLWRWMVLNDLIYQRYAILQYDPNTGTECNVYILDRRKISADRESLFNDLIWKHNFHKIVIITIPSYVLLDYLTTNENFLPEGSNTILRKPHIKKKKPYVYIAFIHTLIFYIVFFLRGCGLVYVIIFITVQCKCFQCSVQLHA